MDTLLDYDNFFLPVEDLEKAREFYGKQLGLQTKFDFPDKGMTAFKIGDNEPAIILSTVRHAKPTIWFTVADVERACEHLKKNGILFLSEPFEIMTGLAVEFNDPFGNKLGITDYSKSKKA